MPHTALAGLGTASQGLPSVTCVCSGLSGETEVTWTALGRAQQVEAVCVAWEQDRMWKRGDGKDVGQSLFEPQPRALGNCQSEEQQAEDLSVHRSCALSTLRNWPSCRPCMHSGISWCQLTIAMLRSHFVSPRNLSTLESKTGKRHSLGGHVWLCPKAA